MTRLQWAVVGGSLLLFLVLYFGFDTTPPEFKEVERTRSAAIQTTNLGGLLRRAKADLTPTDAGEIIALESQLHDALETDTLTRLESLQSLSKKWYDLEKYGVAAGYAEQVADLRQTEEAWTIAGANYTYCVQNETEERIREYCSDQAVKAFENAYTINPANQDHQINLALVYVERPPAENPMRGIRMLLDLNQREPDNVNVLMQLGRLALKTNQFDKAVIRLEKAVSLRPENLRANCLLSEAYRGTGNTQLANQYAGRCSALRKDLERRFSDN